MGYAFRGSAFLNLFVVLIPLEEYFGVVPLSIAGNTRYPAPMLCGTWMGITNLFTGALSFMELLMDIAEL